MSDSGENLIQKSVEEGKREYYSRRSTSAFLEIERIGREIKDALVKADGSACISAIDIKYPTTLEAITEAGLSFKQLGMSEDGNYRFYYIYGFNLKLSELREMHKKEIGGEK